MPAIDGLEFLMAVRNDYPDLPFVLFTNKGSEDVASEAINHDVHAYVPKCTSTDQYDRLTQHIRRVLADHERPGLAHPWRPRAPAGGITVLIGGQLLVFALLLMTLSLGTAVQLHAWLGRATTLPKIHYGYPRMDMRYVIP